MDRVIEVVYEEDVFKPLESVGLPEHQRVTITLHLPPVGNPNAELAAWQDVYTGLGDQDIQAVETIAFDRTHLMAPES